MVTRPGLCSLTDWKLPRPPDVPPELMGMSVRLPPHLRLQRLQSVLETARRCLTACSRFPLWNAIPEYPQQFQRVLLRPANMPVHTTPSIHPSTAATPRSSGVNGGLKKLPSEPPWAARCSHAATAYAACSSPSRPSFGNRRVHNEG